jgi:hypothetical protein
VTLLEHPVPADFTGLAYSGNGLDSPLYAVDWEHLVRPMKPPCTHYRMESGVPVYVDHFPHPDGGCFYGCEETP